MAGVLVIGYGNPFRGDDGFGPSAAGLVQQLGVAGVEVIVSQQLNPELAIPLSQAQYAVFLDAAVGEKPGRLSATAIQPGNAGSASHHFEPATLLALARDVYGRAPAATLITATAANFEHGAQITHEVSLAAAAAARAIAFVAGSTPMDDEAWRAALRRESASACTS